MSSPLQPIKDAFDRYFEVWHITLTQDDLEARRRGSIRQAGWTINFVFGEENGREYLDFYASHRMTNDRLVRIYADGAAELLDAFQVFLRAADDAARRECDDHNRRFYARVEERGLHRGNSSEESSG